MAPEEVERFEGAAGALLDELGYPRAFPNLRPETVHSATRIRNLLANEPRDVRPYQSVEIPQNEAILTARYLQ
jgi:hypothetical protein